MKRGLDKIGVKYLHHKLKNYLSIVNYYHAIDSYIITSRNEGGPIALQFTKILGPESLSHLQNLVLYNSGAQISQVEEELASHLGIRQLDPVE